MPKSARSFADDMRARSDEQLRVLLAARPDLTRPAPADLTSLAARAATRGSAQRALDSLSADHLRVLEAVLVDGADAAPKLLSTTKRAVQASCRFLWDRGLLWRSPEGYRASRAVSEILSNPARLGPTARDLGATDRSAEAPAAYEKLSAAARSAIDRLMWRHPRASFEGASATGVLDELVTAGLVVRTEDGGVIPREVGLALRGGRLYADGITLRHHLPSGSSRTTSTRMPPELPSTSSGGSTPWYASGTGARRGCCDPVDSVSATTAPRRRRSMPISSGQRSSSRSRMPPASSPMTATSNPVGCQLRRMTTGPTRTPRRAGPR
ncbi:hypothetical protein [Flexivirga alba]|uniref:Uncharacterized protein n=1 Tax=Flexivirga alba TaxID=702742 RepID=A0ABW2AB64_9MICO